MSDKAMIKMKENITMSIEDESMLLNGYKGDEIEQYPPKIGEGSIFIEDFNPNEKTFCFNFPGETCYKNVHGICALDKYKKELEQYDYDYYGGDCHKYPSCVNIYFGLRDKSIRHSMPFIYQFECGHYICGDGQHRICVAQKMNLLLDVEYYTEVNEGKCCCCSGF